MNFNWQDIFFSIVIFQLLFLGLFLLSSEKGRRVSNILLGLFFLSICFNLVDTFLILKKVYFNYPSLGLWGSCLPLLFGPLLYQYCKSVLYKYFHLNGKQWLHFLPFLLGFLFTEFAYLSLPNEKKITLMQGLLDRKLPTYSYWATVIIFGHFFIYAGASLRLIGRFKKQATEKFSDANRQNISWLSTTLLFFVMLMIFGVMNGLVSLTPYANYYYLLLALVLVGLIIFLNRILLKAMRRPEIFSIIEEDKTEDERPAKYAYSNISPNEKKAIEEKLRNYMSKEKPFLEAELTLEQLAGQLSLKPKVLSQVINESLNQNFFDFVNHYRIDEAKRLLTNPVDKKVTVLEVLYESGFNSKSSFNTLFKKYTGITPSEFKKRHAHDEGSTLG
jgi:AraC-like DNA-binding protein